MLWDSKTDIALLVSVTSLCIIILWNIANKLGKILPFHVNCWFCNENTWVLFPERNCWTCPSCDQYNGFARDGDYNRPLPIGCESTFKSPHSVRIKDLPMTNGLCYMCNINQQLKVAQLANFVPINEANFDKEIYVYKLQLEKAYKLCLHCRRYLKSKLLKEKESLLGSKLIESRLLGKKCIKNPEYRVLKKFIKYFFMVITFTLVIFISRDCYIYILRYKYINTLLAQTMQVVCSLFERILTVFQAKLHLTFPILEDYDQILYQVYTDYCRFFLHWTSNINIEIPSGAKLQQVFAGVGCLIQIVCHLCSKNIVNYQTSVDTLWAVLLIAMIEINSPMPVLLFLKLLTSTSLFIAYNSVSEKLSRPICKSSRTTFKNMKNLSSSSIEFCSKQDSSSESCSEDDVALSQCGFNQSFSFNDKSFSEQPFITEKFNSSFSKNTPSIWNVPSHNSTFRSSVFDPSYDGRSLPKKLNVHQKLDMIDSDSDLDGGISGLNLGTSPRKSRPRSNIFAIRKFDRPMFAVPTSNRPLICPSRLSQGTSWVAGGYWGDEGNRALYVPAASRSSSQSSGIESNASTNFQRSLVFHPPSREDSVCSEFDRISVFSDPPPQKFSVVPNAFLGDVRSPVYPQMRYDNHIYIPQPFNTQSADFQGSCRESKLSSSNSFSKLHRSSNLIKLPHLHSKSNITSN